MTKQFVLLPFLVILWGAQTWGQTKHGTWTVNTEDTRIILDIKSNDGLWIRYLGDNLQHWNWARAPIEVSAPDTVRLLGRTQVLHWEFAGALPSSHLDQTVTLVFESHNPEMKWLCTFEAQRGPGPVRQRQSLVNLDTSMITMYNQQCLSLNVSPPPGAATLTNISDDAGYPDSVGVYKEPLTKGFSKVFRISDAQDWIPLFFLQSATRQGLYAGWEWSIGQMNAEKQDTGIMLRAGLGANFKTDLYPRDTFQFPAAYVGAYTGDLDDGGNHLRRYLFNHCIPDMIRNDATYPKVEWNAFAATGKGLGSWDSEEKKYYPLIDDITPLGFEEVVLDIGWWRDYGDPGHIIVDSADWPHGIAAAAGYAHQHKMRFGLYDNEPELLSGEEGKRERYSDLAYLLTDLHADFYRSDATAGSVLKGGYGSGQRAHYDEDYAYWGARGFYEVIDSLIKHFKGFGWENCSAGGGIKDYAAVRRMTVIQNQDTYKPLDARRAFYDASYALHPMQLASLTGSFSQWQASGSVYEFRSSSMGAAYWHPDAPNGGNGGPVWSAKQKADVLQAVNTYKQRLRPLIRKADLYHIFQRPDGVVWDGIEYFDPASHLGAVYIFKPDQRSPKRCAVILKGLHPSRRYRLTFEDHTHNTITMVGKQLLTAGIGLSLPDGEASEIMHIEELKP